jgi:hypothetical protein
MIVWILSGYKHKHGHYPVFLSLLRLLPEVAKDASSADRPVQAGHRRAQRARGCVYNGVIAMAFAAGLRRRDLGSIPGVVGPRRMFCFNTPKAMVRDGDGSCVLIPMKSFFPSG